MRFHTSLTHVVGIRDVRVSIPSQEPCTLTYNFYHFLQSRGLNAHKHITRVSCDISPSDTASDAVLWYQQERKIIHNSVNMAACSFTPCYFCTTISLPRGIHVFLGWAFDQWHCTSWPRSNSHRWHIVIIYCYNIAPTVITSIPKYGYLWNKGILTPHFRFPVGYNKRNNLLTKGSGCGLHMYHDILAVYTNGDKLRNNGACRTKRSIQTFSCAV